MFKSRQVNSSDQNQGNVEEDNMFYNLPSILQSEVSQAIHRLKPGKSPGDDMVRNISLTHGGDIIVETLTKLYNKCLRKRSVAKSWMKAVVILIHKKEDTTEVSNYGPISLISSLYKVFSHIILQRIRQGMDWPREQAGFRKGFSTIDHLHVINQIQEKTYEYQLPLYMAFVDYKKAFDSIENAPLFRSMRQQGIDKGYIKILQHFYSKATSIIRLEKDSAEIKLERGTRQGDNISPHLFNTCLQNEVIDKIDWDQRGISIDGEYLIYLIYADDLVLFSHSATELQDMLQDVCDASRKIGLLMNLDKTRIMRNEFTEDVRIKVDNREIEDVNSYTYLGQIITNDHDQTKELRKRIGLGWSAFARYRSIMRNTKVKMDLKRKIFNECILPIMTYGSQTWSISNTKLQAIAIAQRKMERQMLGVTLLDKKRNDWIREKTKVVDIIDSIRGNLHRCALAT